MGGLWGWPKSHRGLEPSLCFCSDKIFPCSFKGVGAEYLMNCVALSFPYICLPLAVLGSSLAAVGVFFQPMLLPPGIFEYLQSCHGLVSLGWCREGFLFGLCCSLSLASLVPARTVLRSVGSWVFQCSLQFCLLVRDRKCSPWVWPRTEGAFSSMTTVNCH